ncbi:MAG: aldo/keto reductase [Clostridia bacterium]|nr:aldo/keto reductase [Clostridia bacterium]
MEKMILGRTGLEISRTGFGALPIQRISFDAAKEILVAALDGGITFIDTARAYSNSEEKIGYAISDRRDEFIVATKTHSKSAAEFWTHLETSLKNLKTDHIDIYQFHNPGFVPKPGDGTGLYEAALEARAQGKIRFIGITQHSIDRAFEAIHSGLYDTLQYPFNHLASERDIELVKLCQQKGVGFIAMKALSGGLVTDASVPFTFISEFPNVVPIWGIQRLSELEEILEYSNGHPPVRDAALEAKLARDQKELVGAFCRSCGYCLPCPVGIPIQNANRMKQLMTRSPYKPYLSKAWQADMEKITQCTKCGACAKKCPYELKPYETLPQQLAFYREFLKAHADEAE